MRSNIVILLVMAAYFTLADIAYGIWTYLEWGYIEPIGTAAIAMLGIMSAFLAFYLQKTDKVQGSVPEDRLDANIEDGDTEIGFFTPWSWWPFFLGLFGSIVFAALAIGWWLFFIGFPLALVALIGFVFELHRGQYAH